MREWGGHTAKSPCGAIHVAMSPRQGPSKLKTRQTYFHRRSSPRGGMNSSSGRRSRSAAGKNRNVSRRLEEPLEAELVVLFGTTSLIILVPWVVKDPRFLVLLPMAVFLVPGLLDTCKAAFAEIVHSVNESKNGGKLIRRKKTSLESKSRNTVGIIDRYPKGLSQRSLRSLTGTRQRAEYPVSDMERTSFLEKAFDPRESRRGEDNGVKREYIKLIPFLKHWGGFL